MKMKYYFDEQAARTLATQLDLDADEYAAWVAPRVDDIEISQRVDVFAEGLRDRLPKDYLEALAHVVPRLGPELGEGEGYFNNSFYLWPVSRFIEKHGLDYPEESLNAIEALTRVFTGEWAIRPYLATYPDLTMQKVQAWARSESHNVRRLASEGIRPRLPWAKVHRAFTEDPRPIIPVLDQLRADSSRYVRTSVANNLNDISRTHPELVLETARRWLAEAETGVDAGADAEKAQAISLRVAWVVERALRGLIKQGNPEALELVGFAASEEIEVIGVDFPEQVRIGEKAMLVVRLRNQGTTVLPVRVEYRMHFLKKNGERKPSTFVLGRLELAPGEEREVSKAHVFRVVSTRVYYPGTQAVSVVVNGREEGLREFELVA